MTLDRYKFLGALLVLRDEFTVEDIVRFAKLPRGTVATFLNREGRFVERSGTIQTGRRGGQVARYKVRKEAFSALEREADQLTPSLPSAIQESISTVLPASLVVAEDAVNRLIPAATATERPKIIEVARFLVGNAEKDVQTVTGRREKLRMLEKIRSLKAEIERSSRLAKEADTPTEHAHPRRNRNRDVSEVPVTQ